MGFKPLLVLFVSTGNAARSQMAEAILNAKKSDSYRARSAGTEPWEALDPQAKAILEMAGFATEKMHPKRWQDFYHAHTYVPVDVIVTLSAEAQEIVPLDWPDAPVRVHWAIDDPLSAMRSDVREWKFRKVLSVLDARIQTLVRQRPPASREELLLRLKDAGMVV